MKLSNSQKQRIGWWMPKVKERERLRDVLLKGYKISVIQDE